MVAFHSQVTFSCYPHVIGGALIIVIPTNDAKDTVSFHGQRLNHTPLAIKKILRQCKSIQRPDTVDIQFQEEPIAITHDKIPKESEYDQNISRSHTAYQHMAP